MQVTNSPKFEIVATADSVAYWSGNAGTNVWGDGTATNTNWWTTAAGTTVASVPSLGTDVFMTANTPTNFFATTVLNTNYEINSLTFTGTGTANTAGSIVSGNALTLDAASGAGITVQSGSGANTISSNVVLGTAATQTWANNSTNLLTVSGGVSGTNKNLIVATSASGGDVTISSAITTGTGTLTKNNSGTLTLSGSSANTFTGLTTINGGELDLGKTGVNAIGGDLTVAGGTAKITGTGGDQIPNSKSVVVSGGTFDIVGNNETVAGVQLASGNINGTSGVLTSTSNFDVRSGSTSAILAGSVGLDKTTGGTVTLSGANTYSGNTTINEGTLQAGATGVIPNGTGKGNVVLNGGTVAGTLDVNGNDTTINGLSGTTGAVLGEVVNNVNGTTKTFTVGNGNASGSFAGNIKDNNNAGTGVLALTKTGTGTQTLSGANTFTGATIVSGGTLEAAGAATLGSTSSVTVNTGGTLLLSGSGDRINNTASMTLAGGTLNLNGVSNETVGTLTLSGNSVIDFGALGTATTMHFANSSAATWGSFTLQIWNWEGNPYVGGGTDQLFFGSDNTGLISSQLNKITFYPGDGTSTPYSLPTGFAPIVGSSFGEVAPVPEPSAVVACLSLLGLAGYRERRRFVRRREAKLEGKE